jgi:hypothetical protein
MEVEFSLMPQDFKAFLVHCQKRSAAQTAWIPKTNQIWLIVLAFLIAWIILGQPGVATFAEVIGYIVPGIVGAALGAFGTAAFLGRKHNLAVPSPQEYLDDPRQRHLFEPRRVIISADGFGLEAAKFRTYSQWSLIHELDAVEDYAFFWTGPTEAYLVPGRAFRDQQEFEDFVALARRYQQGQASPQSDAITTSRPVASQDGLHGDSP